MKLLFKNIGLLIIFLILITILSFGYNYINININNKTNKTIIKHLDESLTKQKLLINHQNLIMNNMSRLHEYQINIINLLQKNNLDNLSDEDDLTNNEYNSYNSIVENIDDSKHNNDLVINNKEINDYEIDGDVETDIKIETNIGHVSEHDPGHESEHAILSNKLIKNIKSDNSDEISQDEISQDQTSQDQISQDEISINKKTKINYDNYNKEQLKQLCEEKGIPKTGNKGDIIKRLQTN